MPSEEGYKNLIPVKKGGKAPPGAGRKPAHLKPYLKENNIGTQDVRAILGGILVGCKSLKDMQDKVADPNTPPIVKIPLLAMIKEMQSGKLNAFQFLVQYGYGMPKQEIETKAAIDDAANMTPEERKEAEKELLKQLVKENRELIKELINEDDKKDN
jgi:hypothetical protein